MPPESLTRIKISKEHLNFSAVEIGVSSGSGLVTDASSGIGRAITTRFVPDGYNVINISRHPCAERGVENMRSDLAVPGAADSLAGALTPWIADAGRVCLVHDASAMHLDRVDNLASADLRASLELNLVAPNALNRICIPLLKPGSSILYIGSTLAKKAVPGVSGYIIAKHGVVGLMRATCQDLAERGIHICMICQGFTDTRQLRALNRRQRRHPGLHHRTLGLRSADRARGDRRGGRLRRPRLGPQRRPDPRQPGAARAMSQSNLVASLSKLGQPRNDLNQHRLTLRVSDRDSVNTALCSKRALLFIQ